MTSSSSESSASGAGPTLERRLGFISLTIYGLGNMLGAGIYGTIGVAAKELGNALWLAFAASVVAAGLTGLSYACLGSRYPRAAGAAYITERAFGSRFLTYMIGLTIMCSGLTSMAAASHVFGSHFLSAIGVSLSVSGADWAVRGVVLPFLLAIAFVNFWGIRESALFNAVCTFVEAEIDALDLLRAVAGVGQGGAGDDWVVNAKKVVAILVAGIRTPAAPASKRRKAVGRAARKRW